MKKEMTIEVSKTDLTYVGNGKYSYGKTTGNKGEAIEAFLRKTLQPTDNRWYKKDSTAYDVGSDIELSAEERISVKSGSQFSITEKITAGLSTEEARIGLIERYEKTVHSNLVAYGRLTETENNYIIQVVIFPMDIFVELLKKIGTLTATDSRKNKYKLRIKKSENRIIKELNELGV